MTPSVVVETNSTKSVAGSLAAKIQSAYLWTGAFQIGKSLLGFVISILLARRLQPSDYGLVGMVTVLIAIVSVFQDWGIGQAVIYFKEDSEEDLATYFTVTTATGVVLTVALFLCAPIVASFYREPRLMAIVRVLSSTFLSAACGRFLKDC